MTTHSARKAQKDWITPDTLLSEIADGNLVLSTPKEAARGMIIYDVRLNNAPVRLKLAMGDDITVAFEPSSWNSTETSRKTITFNAPDIVLAAAAELEDWCRQVLEDKHPHVQSMWSSAVKPADKYQGKLRTKITLEGPRATRFYDETAQPTVAPDTWQGRSVQAVVQVRGIYIQKQGVGLMLDTTDVKIGPPVLKQPDCPFD